MPPSPRTRVPAFSLNNTDWLRGCKMLSIFVIPDSELFGMYKVCYRPRPVLDTRTHPWFCTRKCWICLETCSIDLFYHWEAPVLHIMHNREISFTNCYRNEFCGRHFILSPFTKRWCSMGCLSGTYTNRSIIVCCYTRPREKSHLASPGAEWPSKRGHSTTVIELKVYILERNQQPNIDVLQMQSSKAIKKIPIGDGFDTVGLRSSKNNFGYVHVMCSHHCSHAVQHADHRRPGWY